MRFDPPQLAGQQHIRRRLRVDRMTTELQKDLGDKRVQRFAVKARGRNESGRGGTLIRLDHVRDVYSACCLEEKNGRFAGRPGGHFNNKFAGCVRYVTLTILFSQGDLPDILRQ